MEGKHVFASPKVLLMTLWELSVRGGECQRKTKGRLLVGIHQCKVERAHHIHAVSGH